MSATGDGPGALTIDAPEAPPARAPGFAHVPALDGLRGLAVGAVLLFHGGYLTGGWLGVDLFFVLSGYLITSLLLVEHRAEGRVDLVGFWGRRARRLLPALLLVVLAVALYAWLELSPADLATVRSDGLATLFFAANWHDILGGVSYWDRGLSPSMFAHTWSLAVEEQLYVVWPIVLSVVLARARRRPEAVARVAITVAIASAAVALSLSLLGASTARIYLGTDTRAVAVALGGFVAGWRRRRGGLSDAAAGQLEVLGIVAAVLLGLAWWRLSGTSSFTYRGGLLGATVLAAVVVAAAADIRSRRLAAVLSVAPLRMLGLISYGAYLWHWPVYLVLTSRRTGLDGMALLLLRIAVTLAVAAASYRLVERPIRARRPEGWWTGQRGRAAAIGGLAIAVIALLGATLGAVALPADELSTGVDRAVDAPAGTPRLLVLGDSVAAAAAAPAIAHPSAYGVDVLRSTVLGCQAVWDGRHRARGIEGDVSRPPSCPHGVAALVSKERPDAVLVLYGGWTDAELEIDGRWRSACDAPYERQLRTRFAAVLADATATGAPVIVSNAARSTNTFRRDDNWDHTACTNAVMQDVASRTEGVTVIDLDGWLCPKGRCRDRIGGLLVRSDGVHFQGPGGAKATRWLLAQVLAAAHLGASTTTGETPEDRALARVCSAYGDIQAVVQALVQQGLGVPGLRSTITRSLALFDDATLADLDPQVAADLRPLGDPKLRDELFALFDRAETGELVGADDISPATLDAMRKAGERFKHLC